MNKQVTILTIISMCFLVSCTAETTKKNEQKTIKKTAKKMTKKQIAVKAQEAFFKNFSDTEVKEFFSENYIQHNPQVPTGITPVIGFLPILKDAGTTYKTHRVFQDGNFVVMHNSYDNAEAFGAKEVVTFDIYRIENGKVAEHWDAITPKVKNTASGRTQVDGPVKIVDLDKTASNKELVKNFVNDVLFGKAPEKITEYVSTEKYLQHNTAIKDGLEGLNEAIQNLIAQNDMFTYKKTHKILGEGNFVLTQSEGEWHGKPHAFYDLFRVEDGKIVEHWDIIQEIPGKMAHSNGMF